MGTLPQITGSVEHTSAGQGTTSVFEKDRYTELWISWNHIGETMRIAVGSGLNPGRKDSELLSFIDKDMHLIGWLSFGVPFGQSAHLDRLCFDAALAQGYNEHLEKLPSPFSRKNIFSINEQTGQMFLNSPILDYESASQFSVLVSVNDGDLSSFSTVLISVTNMPEPPVAMSRCARDFTSHACGRINENSPIGTQIGASLEIIDQDSSSYFPGKSALDEECSTALKGSSLKMTQMYSADLTRNTDLTRSVTKEFNDASVPERYRVSHGVNFGRIMENAVARSLPFSYNSSFLVDMNKLTSWNSEKGLTAISIELSFENTFCFSGLEINWQGLNAPSTVDILSLEKGDSGAFKVGSYDGLQKVENRKDIFRFEPMCDVGLNLTFGRSYTNYYSISDIEVIESSHVIWLSESDDVRLDSLQIPLYMAGEQFQISSLSVETPLGGNQCSAGVLEILDSLTGTWRFAADISFSGEKTMVSSPVFSERSRITGISSSSGVCMISDIKIYGRAKTTPGAIISITNGSCSSYWSFPIRRKYFPG